MYIRKTAGQMTILPVLGFTLFEKCKNSVSPPSSTSFKYTEKTKALLHYDNLFDVPYAKYDSLR